MDLIKIVLAEDHSLMRQGTRFILEQCPDFQVSGEAEDGEQALDQIKRLQPDVAILDIRMPKLNGIEVVQKLKDAAPRTRALMLTAYDDDDYILALMQAGAAGYILKTAQPKELVEAVRSVYRGEAVLHPAVAMKVARLWAQGAGSAQQNQPEQLTPREIEILELAAQGCRNKTIAERLNISIRTVEGHFNTIFTKLNIASRIEAVMYALSHKLVRLDKGK